MIAVTFFNLKKLPSKYNINQDLYNEPIQASSSSLGDFKFSYRNKEYQVKPIADYEIWGLVVSVNNIKAWYNLYHDKNSVNLKDVCIIWGDNLKNNAYKQIEYKSGEWTCYYSWQGKLDGSFSVNKISNNHLLSDDAEVRNTIEKMNIGDQIHIKGSLVSYAEAGSNQYRTTSLDRNDSGNGACEIVFASSAEILQKRFPDFFRNNIG